MKKLCILCCALLLLACGNKQKEGADADGTRNENECSADSISHSNLEKDMVDEIVRVRVTNIYDKIFGWYLTHADSVGIVSFNTDEYLSEDYMKLYRKVMEQDSELKGEIGFFDGDHWIQGQDWGSDLNMQIEHIEIVDSNHARCKVRIHNGGSDTPLILSIVRQKENWYIDDFIDQTRDYSEKEQMQKYLN